MRSSLFQLSAYLDTVFFPGESIIVRATRQDLVDFDHVVEITPECVLGPALPYR